MIPVIALLMIQTASTPHCKVELIAENTAIAPGESARIGVRVTMDDGWHIYWKNPGDSGIPTKINWNLPKGWKVSDMKWPTPQAIEADGFTSFGYEKSVLFMTRIVAPKDAKIGSNIPISADMEFLICKESCLPGNAKLSTFLKVGDAALIKPTKWAEEFESTALYLPRSTANWNLSAENIHNIIILSGQHPDYVQLGEVKFFGEDPGAFDNSLHLPAVSRSAGIFTLNIPVSPYASKPPTRIKGVLTGFGTHSYEINVPITN
ncbi:MAG: hypothetical protein KF824_11750 [Fimbriimonadaceae bacterium]|nr:MAG: hypothetical protein KF824_11750 [Fimbriimonadaceae bacterium]